MSNRCIALVMGLVLSQFVAAQTSDLPHSREENGVAQFVVHGKPFVIFGGELGNSSAGTASQADAILPEMARMQLNTALMPVAWEQTEPTEGKFEFGILTLPAAQSAGRTRGVVLHANSPRGTQSVALGGYVFEASLSRAWKTGALLTDNGAMLLLQSGPDEFIVVGSGLTVKMKRDPDTDDRIAGIANIEEVSRTGSEWVVITRLNGDQSNQGRQLTMDSTEIRIYRLRMYSAAQ